MYKLKGESFSIVDGPEAGKKFVRGANYDTVPEAYADRFEALPDDDAGETTDLSKNEYVKKSKTREDK